MSEGRNVAEGVCARASGATQAMTRAKTDAASERFFMQMGAAWIPPRALPRLHSAGMRAKKKPPVDSGGFLENGAGEETRTLDVHLGKVVLYQLSYARKYEIAGGKK